jgi:propanediol dehydratase small subunit
MLALKRPEAVHHSAPPRTEQGLRMSDDPILSALSRLEAGQAKLQSGQAKLEAGQAKLEAEQERLRELVNIKLERILDEIGTLRTDFQNTKGFLLEDAIVLGRRTLTIEERLSRLERKSPD